MLWSFLIWLSFPMLCCLGEWSWLKWQVALCAGAGGLGSMVSQALLRLGVKKVILIDYDKVDISNLTRQTNYSVKVVF